MSAVFEGVVISGDEAELTRAFDGLNSRLPLRLARLTHEILGIYRFEYAEGRLFDLPELERIAQELSKGFGPALVVFYDDRAHAMGSALFAEGALLREFGEADEIWVRLDEEGLPDLDGPRFSGDALPEDFEDGDCIRGAIDAGLEAAGFGVLGQAEVMAAFCEDEYGWLAEAAPHPGGPS